MYLEKKKLVLCKMMVIFQRMVMNKLENKKKYLVLKELLMIKEKRNISKEKENLKKNCRKKEEKHKIVIIQINQMIQIEININIY